MMLTTDVRCERHTVDMTNTIASNQAENNRRMDRIEQNVGRIAMVPAACMLTVRGGTSERRASPPANLMKCPRDLFVLWAEYEAGIGGNKPARQFSPAERGKVKFKYCRRKIVWDVIDAMINAGCSAQVAIDRIYDEYGRLTVTEIKKAKATGGNPRLR